jgi:flagellar hook-associated protein 1 FlgK
LESRDTLINDVITDLDTLANSFASEINAIQTTGFGLKGYSSLTSYEKVDADTTLSLNTAGFSAAVKDGGFNIEVRDAADNVTSIYIQVDADGIGFDTTLESLRDEINTKLTAAGFTDLSSSIDSNGFISLTSASSALTFNFSDDSSGVLHTLGWGTVFNGAGARGLEINSLIANDTDFLAAGLSTGNADNSNISKVISLREAKVLNSNSDTIEEFYRGIVSNVGANTARKTNDAINSANVVASLESERLTISGVNTDEELVNLMTYQRGYQSAARFISVVDDLLDTLINGLF